MASKDFYGDLIRGALGGELPAARVPTLFEQAVGKLSGCGVPLSSVGGLGLPAAIPMMNHPGASYVAPLSLPMRLATPISSPGSIPSGSGVPSISGFPGTVAPPHLPAASAAPHIRFLDVEFCGPFEFSSAWLPPSPGVYAIIVRNDIRLLRPYRPIYFGKTDRLSSRATSYHERYEDWCQVSGGPGSLLIAYRSMMGSRDAERVKLETQLIERYAPACNDQHNAMYGLPGLGY